MKQNGNVIVYLDFFFFFKWPRKKNHTLLATYTGKFILSRLLCILIIANKYSQLKWSEIVFTDLTDAASTHYNRVVYIFKVGLWSINKYREEEENKKVWDTVVMLMISACCPWMEPYGIDWRTRHVLQEDNLTVICRKSPTMVLREWKGTDTC